ncbi:MAG: DNA methyltransferase [Candidatus Micrarchaeota archaeon]
MVEVQTTLMEECETTNHKPETYTGIYSMHKYWSKKPFNIIRHFILKYSKKGEIILDPFCGSGVSVTESIFTGRKAVGVDINPTAIFIVEQMMRRISSKKLKETYKILEDNYKDRINSFYLVKRGNKQFIGTHFLWESGKLMEVWYKTGNRRNSKVISSCSEEDLKLSKSFSYENIPYYYPKNNFFHNSRINADRKKRIYELFTPRNLMALSLLLHSIDKIEDRKMKDMMKFCFTSAVGQASKMVFVIKRRGKFNGQTRTKGMGEVGSWVIGYWMPRDNFEINAWNCFENKFKRILKAKKEQENKKYDLFEAKNFNEIVNQGKNFLLINDSALSFLKSIPSSSIDYIITDPPHGNRIPYLEQSMMWNGWLKKEVNYENEIVISDSKDRKKDITNYYFLLNQVFEHIERVLKPGCHFSLMFNSLDDKTWINLITFMNTLNFDLDKIETLGYSANSVVQDTRGAGLKTDFMFTFTKNLNRKKKEIEIYTMNSHKEIIKNKIGDYLRNANNGLETYEILNKLLADFLQENKFFKLSEVLDVIKNDYKKIGNKWVGED